MIYTFSGMYSINHCLTLAWYPLLHHRFLTLFLPSSHREKKFTFSHFLFTKVVGFFWIFFLVFFLLLKKSQIWHQSLSTDSRNKDVLQLSYSPDYNLDNFSVFFVRYLPLRRKNHGRLAPTVPFSIDDQIHSWSYALPLFSVLFPNLTSGFKEYLAWAVFDPHGERW